MDMIKRFEPLLLSLLFAKGWLTTNAILIMGLLFCSCEDTSTVNNKISDGFDPEDWGELIRLIDSNGLLVDEVRYNNSYPWPTEPDGNGPTLELIHPSLDNNLGLNWVASDGYGTPGAINSVYVIDSSNSIDSAVEINEINYNSADG